VNSGDLERVDELLAPGYRLHFPALPRPVDRQGHLELLAAFWAGFSDWQETVDDVVAEGDRVVIRVTGRGTHDGDFQGIPATGKQVTATGIGIGRISDGRIAEAWAQYDRWGCCSSLAPCRSLGRRRRSSRNTCPHDGTCGRPLSEGAFWPTLASTSNASATTCAGTPAPRGSRTSTRPT
jgi:steroid delta-isomerase-like uncharacterized protein